MSEHISDADFIAVMNEAFSRGQQIKFTPTGRSMLPMLDGVTDTVTFDKKPAHLHKYDVAFYQRPNGQLVLHRVIDIADDGSYVFSGDGQYYYEYGIIDENILALMVAFTHKGVEHSVSDTSYRLYIRWMMLKKRSRILAAKIYHRIFGTKKK